MNSKYLTVCLLIMIIMTGCGIKNDATQIGQPKINKDSNDIWEIIPESDFPQPKITLAIDDISNFTQWLPVPFKKEGKLQKKWAHEFEPNKNRSEVYAGGLPSGWSLLSTYLIDDGYMSGVIDPDNGKFTPKLHGEGITDGRYVFIDHSLGPNSAHCRKIENDETCWSNLDSTWDASPHFFIVNHCLIYSIDSDNIKGIFRVDPRNGKLIWAIKLKNPINNNYRFSCISSGEYVFALVSKLSNDKYVIGYNKAVWAKLFRIDPRTGDIKLSGLSYGETLCSISNNKKLLITDINPNKYSIIEPDTLNQKTINLNIYPETNKFVKSSAESIGRYILIDLHVYDHNDSKLVFLLDPESPENIRTIINPQSNNAMSVKCINSSLIIEDQKQIRGVDPDTLEILWWIDKKDLGENARVAWLDWRGVCVISDTKIMCFGPK